MAASSAADADSSTGPSSPELVASERALEALADQLVGMPRYALDTEFHRERTYWPKLALVQVAWELEGEPGEPAEDGGPNPSAPRRSRVALVDPLAVDLAPLAKVLQGGGTMVAHAASQDLEVLAKACQAAPSQLFDTQLAAGFLGYGSASLGTLVERFLHVRLTKGDRLTDWSRRPLSASQVAYAAADVAHLLQLADVVAAQLRQRGRLAWAEEECAALLARPVAPYDPEEAWWKLRDSRHFQGASRAIAQEVAGWREEKARALDLPPRMVLPDLALLSIAHSPPSSLIALRQTRGMDPRHLRGGVEQEIMAAIERGKALPPERLRIARSEHVSRELRPAVALASAWVAQLSKDEEVDAALLATRSDMVDFLSGRRGARLRKGWRGELVGAPLERLAEGRASLALDGHGRLLLEDRTAAGRELT
ncbi:MAG TPA: HRDC domain-containing protein [Acidimicrobiales bacterium]|nr:HRDC domain-containing protein [Acidimicrobiales bacterium]